MNVDELAKRLRPALLRALATFRPDVVHVPTGALAALGRDLQWCPSVLVALDAEHKNVHAQAVDFSGVRRRILVREEERMRRFEAAEYGQFGRVVVVSERDKHALQKANPRIAAEVIPNGVDTEYFTPPSVRGRGLTIVFHGVMDFVPNVGAATMLANEIWPHVRKTHSDAHLAIVGRAPTRKVLELARIAGVTVTGEVDDIRPWLNKAEVYVAPMTIGTGIKNKILEAMAMGMPCVATPLALNGIAAVPERDVLVARYPQEIASQVARILSDDRLALELGYAARQYVLKNHDWRIVARKYEGVYESVVVASASE